MLGCASENKLKVFCGSIHYLVLFAGSWQLSNTKRPCPAGSGRTRWLNARASVRTVSMKSLRNPRRLSIFVICHASTYPSLACQCDNELHNSIPEPYFSPQKSRSIGRVEDASMRSILAMILSQRHIRTTKFVGTIRYPQSCWSHSQTIFLSNSA